MNEISGMCSHCEQTEAYCVMKLTDTPFDEPDVEVTLCEFCASYLLEMGIVTYPLE